MAGLATSRAIDTNRLPSQIYQLTGRALPLESGRKFFAGATYVGSAACAGCHRSEVEDWHKTWHSKMEQWATPQTVLGDFDNQVITYNNVSARDEAGKLQRNVTYQVRTHRENDEFFFTVLDADNPANNQTYKVAKTLGGKWNQGYEVKVGDDYMPAMLRYSVTAKEWLTGQFSRGDWIVADGTPDGRPRRPDELPKGQAAGSKCEGCHATGLEFYKDTDAASHKNANLDGGVPRPPNPNDGLWRSRPQPGGHAELGVSCEKCHGPASRHVQAAEAAKAAGKPLHRDERHIVHMIKDLDFDQQTQVCGQCHGRGINRTIGALHFPIDFRPGDRDITSHFRFWQYPNRSFYSNGWAQKNRQQWQDFTKSAHFTKAKMSCITCHTFHGKWEDAQLRLLPQALCTDCHKAGGAAQSPSVEMYQGSPMEEAGVTCINCHMPRIAHRSSRTASVGKLPADASSHVFITATPELKKSKSIPSACESCHTSGRPMLDNVYGFANQMPLTNEELIEKLEQRKTSVKAAIAAASAALSGWEPQTDEAKALLEQAGAKMKFVVSDGSDGVHNFKKAMLMLEEARRLAEAARLANNETALARRSPPLNQPGSSPDGGVEDVALERETLMKRSADQVKLGTQMERGEIGFDLSKARAIFTAFNDKAGKLPSLFPASSETGTRAAPAIWDKPDQWKAAIAKFAADTAAAREQTSDIDTFKGALRNVLQDCRSCHETFRTPPLGLR